MTTKKMTVQEIIVDRLIKAINETNLLPWQKPFVSSSINWYSKHEYTGINRALLEGGEYITVNQLKQHNEKTKSDYWFEKGTPYEIIVFYTRTQKKISESEAEKVRSGKKRGRLIEDGDEYLLESGVLKYYRVYNIKYIKNKQGEYLQPKLGNELVEEHTPAEDILASYIKATGIKLVNVEGKAAYRETEDAVLIPKMSSFVSTEAYYKVLFHELTHSTGIPSRLNRKCFEEYHSSKHERGMEELIAEMGSLLLTSEAGFEVTPESMKNNESYVQSWCQWMRENPKLVVIGMGEAEKAKNFILTGGISDSLETETKIKPASEG